jgi:hypothetical protein
VVGWVILAVWAVSYIWSIVNKSYTPPPELNAALLLIVAGLFGTSR